MTDSPETNSGSRIDPRTVRAYLETEYLVHLDPGSDLALLVGRPSAALRSVHARFGVHSSAFITACNPFSRQLSEAENFARQTALSRELIRRGLSALPGIGQHPSNQWPGEESFLVLGISLEAANEFAKTFEQNGFIWMDMDCTPQLILLR